MGPGPCPWRRSPGREQAPEHPSVGEHSELCPSQLHGWICPEPGGTCFVFTDLSGLDFSRALGGYWEGTGCRWERLQGTAAK